MQASLFDFRVGSDIPSILLIVDRRDDPVYSWLGLELPIFGLFPSTMPPHTPCDMPY